MASRCDVRLSIFFASDPSADPAAMAALSSLDVLRARFLAMMLSDTNQVRTVELIRSSHALGLFAAALNERASKPTADKDQGCWFRYRRLVQRHRSHGIVVRQSLE